MSTGSEIPDNTEKDDQSSKQPTPSELHSPAAPAPPSGTTDDAVPFAAAPAPKRSSVSSSHGSPLRHHHHAGASSSTTTPPPAPIQVVQPSTYLGTYVRPSRGNTSRPMTPAEQGLPGAGAGAGTIATPTPAPAALKVMSLMDREQAEGLRAIRAFLKVRTSYDVLPLSFRLIVLDTALLVKKSLNILNLNGRRELQRYEGGIHADARGQVSSLRPCGTRGLLPLPDCSQPPTTSTLSSTTGRIPTSCTG